MPKELDQLSFAIPEHIGRVCAMWVKVWEFTEFGIWPEFE